MLASDEAARPLSGVGQADMVFEMQVTPDGVTRMMAVYQCEDPAEIGSIRSAREDFIPLAAGLKSIYVHWGGERSALNKLDNGVIDNVDALKYEGTVFYRKAQILPPHDGFTNLKRIFDISKDLDYDLTNSFEGYPHKEGSDVKKLSNIAEIINVNYQGAYGVKWKYNQSGNVYERMRGGEPEIDRNTGASVTAAVVVLMETESQVISRDYMRVFVQGQGSTKVYQNGVVVNGTWKKDLSAIGSKLYFYDTNGNEIAFTYGSIWIEIVTN